MKSGNNLNNGDGKRHGLLSSIFKETKIETESSYIFHVTSINSENGGSLSSICNGSEKWGPSVIL